MSSLSRFNTYHVPPELIAQTPAQPRDSARLMVLRRANGEISHHIFRDLPDLLDERYVLALNNSKVIKARLDGCWPDNSPQTIYLLKKTGENTWQVSGEDLDKHASGTILRFPDTHLRGHYLGLNADETALFQFDGEVDIATELQRIGTVPLPPYIKEKSGADQYQTVYARTEGSVAAPTAGLHFTPQVFADLAAHGVSFEELTLHVGYGTFAHVHHETLAEHVMHHESYTLEASSAARLNAAKQAGAKILAVGTTATRVLESCADEHGILQPGSGETNIFIYPPYQFKYVDALLTNFHMPGLTPIMLVAAFAGYDLTMRAYEIAIAKSYRFYSFGDAMLIF
jgi:S-adenosylmethionine:tRNA ribosyltransferase-isomerase